MPYKKLQYPIYIKEIDPNAHIRLFKKAIKANGEIVEVDIINMFGFILRDNIFEWDENYVQDHPNYTFEELEQTFCKLFIIVKNNEEVYIQLHNIKQQTTKCVEVYYEHLLKLVESSLLPNPIRVYDNEQCHFIYLQQLLQKFIIYES
jgi:hypothetical protein